MVHQPVPPSGPAPLHLVLATFVGALAVPWRLGYLHRFLFWYFVGEVLQRGLHSVVLLAQGLAVTKDWLGWLL